MKVKLYLHGHLKDKVQKDFVEVEATTLIDALKNLEFKYRKVLKAPMDIGRWKIRVKGFEDKESWYVPLFVNEIHIYPAFRLGKSAKTGGVIQMIVGTTLIVVGAAVGIFTGWSGVGGYVGVSMVSTGIALLAQGILSYFFTPVNDTSGSNSKYLGAGQNTTKSGTRIPIGYGTFKIAGQILSYNVSSSNLKVYGE